MNFGCGMDESGRKMSKAQEGLTAQTGRRESCLFLEFTEDFASLGPWNPSIGRDLSQRPSQSNGCPTRDTFSVVTLKHPAEKRCSAQTRESANCHGVFHRGAGGLKNFVGMGGDES